MKLTNKEYFLILVIIVILLIWGASTLEYSIEGAIALIITGSFLSGVLYGSELKNEDGKVQR